MAYSAEISRDNPTNFLFVIDQSGSMDEQMPTGKSKAAFVADVLNKTIYTLVTNCTKADGVRNYFDVGVIVYGGSGVGPGLAARYCGGPVSPRRETTEKFRPRRFGGGTLRPESRCKAGLKADPGLTQKSYPQSVRRPSAPPPSFQEGTK
jgi:hypothetical protein